MGSTTHVQTACLCPSRPLCHCVSLLPLALSHHGGEEEGDKRKALKDQVAKTPFVLVCLKHLFPSSSRGAQHEESPSSGGGENRDLLPDTLQGSLYGSVTVL